MAGAVLAARRRSPLFRRRFSSGLAILLLSTVLSFPAESRVPRFPQAAMIRGKTAAGHPYLSGGISFDEQRAIEGAAQAYNLKLVFASRFGTLVSPEFILIGANSARHVEKIRLRAPWFYIHLPPGGYTILARFKRKVVLMKDIYLAVGARKTYLLRGE